MNNYVDWLAFETLGGKLPGDATPRMVPELLAAGENLHSRRP